jgi:hypothetical protein
MTTAALDIYTVSLRELHRHRLEVREHLERGNPVRVIDASRGLMVGWLYPADREPPGYRGSGLDDEAALRQIAARQRREAGSVRHDDFQCHD